MPPASYADTREALDELHPDFATAENDQQTVGPVPGVSTDKGWQAKLSEIDQIRNRVEHFRRGHADDINRVRQLLRDLDQGFWKFCTSYNDADPIIPVTGDPIAREFAALDPFPWTEVELNTVVRIGHALDDLVMSVTVELLRRPWLKARHPSSVIGHHGYFYDVHIGARGSRGFDYGRFLESTKRLHGRVCHICLDASEDGIRITLPSVAGVGVVLPTLTSFVEAARHAMRPKPSLGICFTDIPATRGPPRRLSTSLLCSGPSTF